MFLLDGGGYDAHLAATPPTPLPGPGGYGSTALRAPRPPAHAAPTLFTAYSNRLILQLPSVSHPESTRIRWKSARAKTLLEATKLALGLPTEWETLKHPVICHADQFERGMPASNHLLVLDSTTCNLPLEPGIRLLFRVDVVHGDGEIEGMLCLRYLQYIVC